jgi:hypothetical protein
MKPTKRGNVRLAFRGGTVVEAKNLQTGSVHTPAEFAADRRASKPRARLFSFSKVDGSQV